MILGASIIESFKLGMKRQERIKSITVFLGCLAYLARSHLPVEIL